MKLSVLTSSVSRNAGGLFTSVRKLTLAVQKIGVTCQVHAFKDDYTKRDAEFWNPLNVYAYARRGFSFFPVSKSMLRAVIDSQPDIVHCHGLWLFPSIVDLSIRRRLNVPYVISPRGMLDPWAVKNSAWRKKLIGFLFENNHLRNATCIHALCQSEADSIRVYGLKNPIAVIPNGMDLPIFNPSTFNVQGTRKKRKLLFLGRIHPKKGIKELIEAWSKVREAWEGEWDLIIAGWDDGGHLDSLKNHASSLGLQWSVKELDSEHCSPFSSTALHFVGPKFGVEKNVLLRCVDAFILPSFSEGLPMSVLEAWAHGLPVLMTPQCNLLEGFTAGAAIKIAPNPDDVAGGLLSLFSMNDVDRQQVGQRGLALVKEKFTWSKIAAEMNEVYQWVLGGGQIPGCVRID